MLPKLRRSKISFFIVLYLISIISANLLVRYVGAYGLWFSSFFLIPFDFVTRCILHEKWKGLKLILYLFALTVIASAITFALNKDALQIAIASISGFASAQVGAGIFYQFNKEKSWFFKVNISDLIAIVFDSIVFQFIAFGDVAIVVLVGQVAIKFTGGLFWYFILFNRAKIQNRI